MMTARSILLACTALVAAVSAAPSAFAAPPQQPAGAAHILLAQAPPPAPLTPEEKKKQEEQKKAAPPPAAAKPAAPPAAAKPAAPPAAAKPAAPPAPPAAAKPVAPQPPAAARPAAPPPAAQAKPPAPPPPPAAQQKPVAQPSPPAAQAKPAAAPPPSGERRDNGRRDSRDNRPDRAPERRPDRAADQKPPAAPVTPPKPADAAQKPAAPAAAPEKSAAPAPAAAPSPAPAPAAQKPAAPAQPAPSAAPSAARTTQQAAPAVAAPPPPPTKPQDASEFIRRKGARPSGGLNEVRKERQETRDGNRVVIQEGNRTIVNDGNRSTIRHNEADRFAVGARNVRVNKSGDQTISVVLRPNGISIVTTTDRDGHLLRRARRDRNGREIVLIDNNFAGARRGDYFVDVRPPRMNLPRDRYIVDARRADRARLYAVFTAGPMERLERRYTLDQVRYSEPLRQYMPRVDLDVNFPTGSWQLTPDQVGSLAAIAAGLNRAIDRNPREIFLVEGHTDAVGTVEDNLSLSDRRAESVAVALTEQFGVPPENLVTQGYGEEYLKVDTDGPSRENRRVAVRRITPLIDQVANR